MKRITLTASLAVAALLSLAFVRQAPRPVQWEYKFVQMKLDFKKTEVKLSELGAEGWEVFAVTEDNGIADFYLKRPK